LVAAAAESTKETESDEAAAKQGQRGRLGHRHSVRELPPAARAVSVEAGTAAGPTSYCDDEIRLTTSGNGFGRTLRGATLNRAD
jgi:hypothetical protein